MKKYVMAVAIIAHSFASLYGWEITLHNGMGHAINALIETEGGPHYKLHNIPDQEKKSFHTGGFCLYPQGIKIYYPDDNEFKFPILDTSLTLKLMVSLGLSSILAKGVELAKDALLACGNQDIWVYEDRIVLGKKQNELLCYAQACALDPNAWDKVQDYYYTKPGMIPGPTTTPIIHLEE
jgi:hypothetical protein